MSPIRLSCLAVLLKLRVQGEQTTGTLRASLVGYHNPLQLALREQKTALPGVVVRAARARQCHAVKFLLEKGIPTNNLLPEQVFVRVGHHSGPVGFYLTRFCGLFITGNILVALELLEGWGDLRKNLFLSAGLLNCPSYYRQNSVSSWLRAKGVGAGIQAALVEEQAP